MRVELRIVSGSLRGRKIAANVNPELRPTPQRVREALFNILGNAIPDRAFIDIFAGTGVIGLEAISRGASETIFVERDNRQSQQIEGYLKTFDVAEKAQVVRTDAYRWSSIWHPPKDPITVYLSPPFNDLTHRPTEFMNMIRLLQAKIPVRSVMAIQLERDVLKDWFEDVDLWDVRKYGRNTLMFWVKEPNDNPSMVVDSN